VITEGTPIVEVAQALGVSAVHAVDGSHPARGTVAADIDGAFDLVEAGRGLNVATAEVAAHCTRPGVRRVPLDDLPDARIALCWRAGGRG